MAQSSAAGTPQPGISSRFRGEPIQRPDPFAVAYNGNLLAPSSANFWVQTNVPFGGYVKALVVNSSGYIFAGTYGAGVYLSTDGGTSWSPINNGLTDLNIYSLIINSSGYIFAGSDSVVYLSTDNGVSWTTVNNGLPSTAVNCFAINSSGYVFAGTNGGVYFSTNNGTNWTAANSGWTGGAVFALAINSAGDMFAAGAAGDVYLSTNNGTSWTADYNGLPNNTIYSLAITPSGNIFAGTNGACVYLSTNNGTSWTSVSAGLPNTEVFALAVNSSGYLFAGVYGYGVYLSTDNGTTWSSVNSGLANTNLRALAINSWGYIFAGTYGGVYLSPNNGTSWGAANNGLPNAEVTSLSVNASGYIFAGVYGYGVYYSTDNGTAWSQVNSGLTNTDVNSIAIDSSGYIFAVTNGGGVFRSAYTTVSPAVSTPPVAPVLTSPANGAAGVSVTPSLSWNAVGGATTYGLQVSTDPNFGTYKVNQTGITGTSYTASGLSNGVRYYWRVNAANAGGTSAWTTAWNFTVSSSAPAPPSSPVLLSPVNHAVGQPTSLTLSWTNEAGATGYQCQVSSDSLFATNVIVNDSSLIDSTASIANLANSTTYYWRVRAYNGGGLSSFSAVDTFSTIAQAPGVPMLITPVNNGTNQPGSR